MEWALSHEGKCNQLLRYLKEQGFDLRTDWLELGLGTREVGNLAGSGLLVDKNMETGISGLFAAGDEIGGAPFGAAPGAFTTGWRAGEMAGRHAGKTPGLKGQADEKAAGLKALCAEMLAPGDGFTWCEVEDTLQNIMDTYCGDIKTEAMLKRGIDRIGFIKKQPMRVSNPHELARALEVRSLIANAEMIVKHHWPERKPEPPVPISTDGFPGTGR